MAQARRSASSPAERAAPGATRILKKYPNRRLYDTQASSYITLADVKKMVLANEPFEVRDAKSGDDLTRSILLQIILEEETGGVPMFSTQMLANIIRFYGHAMQGMMGSVLEKNMQALAELQQRLAESPTFSPEIWSQMLQGQAPAAMQGFMNSYLEQSRDVLTQMQEQMRKQAETVFPGFPPPKR